MKISQRRAHSTTATAYDTATAALDAAVKALAALADAESAERATGYTEALQLTDENGVIDSFLSDLWNGLHDLGRYIEIANHSHEIAPSRARANSANPALAALVAANID